jgi:hypothetical protein
MRDPILNPLRRRRLKAQNDRARFTRKASRAKRLAAKFTLNIRAAQARRRPASLYETVALDGTPVFRILSIVLLDARANGWQGVLNSADRREGVAERFGKMSQAKLYECSLKCQPSCYGNCNPANPPTQGSHLLLGDGVLGKVGEPLAKWQLGLDTSDGPGLRATLERLGYSASRPYSDPREVHHTNLTKDPRRNLIERGRL